jgi:hypothetical protein
LIELAHRTQRVSSIRVLATPLLLGCAAWAGSPAQAQTTAPAPCAAAQLTGHVPSEEEVTAHRKFTLPSIRYPFDSKPGGSWGVALTLQVNESGQVVCYRVKDDFGKDQPLNDQRKALLEQLKDWRYTPFTRGKQPVMAVFSEHIDEEESPRQHADLPEAPLETVHFGLERTACYGVCPVYSVDIAGDGHVIYKGLDFADVLGEHRYEIPREEVARLLEKVRSGDLWSLRDRYAATVTDWPNHTVTIRMGSAERHIVDYAGRRVGMPAAVSNFEHEIDKAARIETWVSLSKGSIERLKAEHFNFRSRDGGELLARSVSDSRDEGALLELVALGAPINGTVGPDERLRSGEETSIIEEALLNGFSALSDALMAQGALKSAGKLDQLKLDAAFRATIVGGRLALVEKIWGAGEGKHPLLTFLDPPDRQIPSRHASPVTLLLTPSRTQDHPWEGLQIVKWLEAQGCDLNGVSSEGITLLHIALTARDAELMRYLLSRGVKDASSGKQGTTALQSAQDEEMALLLLDSGASKPPAGEAGDQFRAYAESRHWNRVVAWLKTHPQ